MFTGKSISDAAADALFQTACDCIKYEKFERKIYHDDVSGIVHTDFKYGSVADVTGLVFGGDVDTPKGSTKIQFVVKTADLENVRHHLKWEKVSFDEFIEEMKNSRKSKSYEWN